MKQFRKARLACGLAALLLCPLRSVHAAGEACPRFSSAQEVGAQSSNLLDEISGMVASRTSPGMFWVHNDSGDSARVFALREDGVLLGIYTLPDAEAVDWEDIAIGPGPLLGSDYLYIGDIGDNAQKHPFVTVYRVLEPKTNINQSLITQDLDGVEAFELRYPEAPTTVFDSEAMIVDPADGSLYLVTKQADGQDTAYVFHAPTLSQEAPTTLTLVASLPLGSTRFSKVTGADIRPGGGEIALRLYGGVKFWRYTGTPDLGSVLAGPSCAVLVRLELQSEAIAFGASGRDFYTTSEQADGKPQPILRYARIGEEGEEGEEEGEGALDGEGDGLAGTHTADLNDDRKLDLVELLRVIQLFNAGAISCDEASEDGYAPGVGQVACTPHAADYAPTDWRLGLSELLRVIQLFSLGGYQRCGSGASEDGYCARTP